MTTSGALRRGLLLLSSLLLLAPAQPALAALVGEPYIEFDSARVISPDDDGQDDSLAYGFCTSEAGQVSAVVTDAAGVAVHRVPARQLGADDCGWDEWDGTLIDGTTAAPDGVYTLTVTGQYGSESLSRSRGFTVDRTLPGTLTEPTTGPLSGDSVDFVLTPAPALPVDSVTFTLGGRNGVAACTRPGLLDGSDYRAAVPVAGCGAGKIAAWATVTWTNQFGERQVYRTATADVTRADAETEAVIATPSRSFNPSEDELRLDYCAVDVAGSAGVAGVLEILGADDAVVATVWRGQVMPVPLCSGWYGSTSSAWWNGRNDGSTPVPDGLYTVRLSVTDAGGTVSRARRPIRIDRRSPVAVVHPAPGAVLDRAEDLVVRPTPDREVTEVDWSLRSTDGVQTCWASAQPDDQGDWVVLPEDSSCSERPWLARASIGWADEFGFQHWSQTRWVGALEGVVLTGRQTLSPDADGQNESAATKVCVPAPAVGAQVFGTVVDPSGNVVRRLSDLTLDRAHTPDDLASGSCPEMVWDGKDDEGDVVADADHVLRVAVTMAGETTRRAERVLVVDRRAPVTVTSPSPGEAVGSDDAVEVTPAPGVEVGYVELSLRDLDSSDTCWTTATRTSDGRWTSRPAEDPDCGPGPWSGTVYVDWSDRFGHDYSYSPPRIEARRRVSLSGARFLSPDGDGSDDVAWVGWCAVDADATSVEVEIAVLDADGRTVRVVHRAAQAPDSAEDAEWGECGSSATWDARDEAGDIVPDGHYTLQATMTGGQGSPVIRRRAILVDRTPPGDVVAPTEGKPLKAGDVVSFRPRAGVELSWVGISLIPLTPGTSWCNMSLQRVDGVWTARVPETCGTGRYAARINTSWTDELGNYRSYEHLIGRVTGFVMSGSQYLEPANGGSLSSGICLYDPSTTGLFDVKVDVLAADGRVVAAPISTSRAADAFGSTYGCLQASWNGKDAQGTFVADGPYTLRAVAQDGQGRQHEATRDLIVDSRVPGRLTHPTSSSGHAGTVDFAWIATPGFEILDGNFSVAGQSGGGARTTPASVDPDSSFEGQQVWRGAVEVGDLTGAAQANAAMRWRDPFGEVRTLNTGASVRVGTRAAVTWGYTNTDMFSPNGDGLAETYDASLCVTAPADTSAHPVVVEVVDSTGRVLRTVYDGLVTAQSTYQPWYGCAQGVTWDGTDAEGEAAPDGDYELVARVRVGDVVQDTKRLTVRLRRDLAVEWLTPQPGAESSSDFQVAVLAADSVVTGVSARLDQQVPGEPWRRFCTSGYASAAVDGVWSLALPIQASYACGRDVEKSDVGITVSWTEATPDGMRWHSWTGSRSVRVLAAPEVSTPRLSTTSLSPNGDGQDDTVAVAACARDAGDGGKLAARLVIKNASGVVVRRVGPVEIDPSSSSWCSAPSSTPGVPVLRWDGADDQGQPLPDGRYDVELRATDRSDLSADATTPVLLARQTLGTVVEPADGTSTSGAIQLGFRPSAGQPVQQVRFTLEPGPGRSGCWSPTVSRADLDGVWRAPLDSVAAGCGTGARAVRAQVWWTDALGGSHSQLTDPVALTLGNAQSTPTVSLSRSLTTVSPNGDGQQDTQQLDACVRDVFAGSDLDVRISILDSQDQPVRTWTSQLTPDNTCVQRSYTWDVRADDGSAVADGWYKASLTATNAAGRSATTTTATFLVDTRVPGTITAPASGTTLSGPTEVAFNVTPGFTVTSASFDLITSGGAYCVRATGTSGGDAVWRATLDPTGCGSGRRWVRANVNWRDSLGTTRGYSAMTQVDLGTAAPRLVLASEAAVVRPVEGYGAVTSFCAAGDPTQKLTISAVVKDEAGRVVKDLAGSQVTPQPVCTSGYGGTSVSWDLTDRTSVPVKAGDYTLAVTATDPSGASASATQLWVVDRRTAGSPLTPRKDDVLAGVAELALTAGQLPFDSVRVSVTSGATVSRTIEDPDSDGVWRTTLPVGALTSGPATVSWAGTWTDRFGLVRTQWFPSIAVTVDTANPPLKVTCQSCPSLIDRETVLRAVTSDGRGEPVALTVDWGDGSPVEERSVTTPYAAAELGHTYASAGLYTASVTARSARGGVRQEDQQLRISDGTRPNTPPVVSVQTSPTQGVAPLDVSTSMTATDDDGDALTYAVNFGDGSPEVRGSLPSAPVTHRYGSGGTYVVRTVISDGRDQVIRLAQVSVALDEPLLAAGGDDLRVVAGQPVTLDGSASRPAVSITRYRWELGDGTVPSDGAVRQHVYTEPGTYRARLTVWAGQESRQDEVAVTVVEQGSSAGVLVTTRHAGSPLAGVDLVVQTSEGDRVSATTGPNGTARLPGLPDGDHTVYAVGAGYAPATGVVRAVSGAGEVVIDLRPGGIATAELTVARMTPAEISAAGIDTSDPANQQVVESDVVISLEGSRGVPFHFYAPVGNNRGGFAKCPTLDGRDGDCGQDRQTVCYDTESYNLCLGVRVVDGQPQLHALHVPVRASWLKEMFNASLLVTNLATDPGFVLDAGRARLAPPVGMSLAPTSTPQQQEVSVPSIPAGQSRTVQWFLRGDKAGSYDLTATYAAALQPLRTPVFVEARTATPVKVWGENAVKFVVDADDEAHGDWVGGTSNWYSGTYPYHVSVRMQNVADVPIYNASIRLSEGGRANFILPPENTVESRSVAELDPGESLDLDLVLIPIRSGFVSSAGAFVLTSGGVRSGDAVTSHPRVPAIDDVPNLEVRQGDGGTALVTFEEVTGATGYRFHAISGRDGTWRELTDVSLKHRGAGEQRVVISGVDPESDLFYAVTSRLAAGPRVIHQVASLSNEIHRPRVGLDMFTRNGTTHTCGSNDAPLTFAFVDGFGVESWTVTQDGRPYASSAALDGEREPDTGRLEVKVPIGQPSTTLVATVTNLAGRSETYAVVIDRTCPPERAVVLAMGLNSSVDLGPIEAVTDPDCEDRTRDDEFLLMAATNACDGGAANSHRLGNLVSYLESKGFRSGQTKFSPNRTLLEFTYGGTSAARVDCVEPTADRPGAVLVAPMVYDTLRTYTELVHNVLPKRTATAKGYMEMLIEYADCWNRAHGEALSYTVIGHSLGGYEAIALLKEARALGRPELIASALTIDGAIQPEAMGVTLGTDCAFGDEVDSLDLTEAMLQYLTDGVGARVRLLAAPITAVNVLAGPTWSTDIIRDARATGTLVGTVTNRYDTCLETPTTINPTADFWDVYDINVGGPGIKGHSAALHRHDAPVMVPGYPVTEAIDRVLTHRPDRAGTASSPSRARSLSARTVQAPGAADAASGRVVTPAGAPHTQGGQVTFVGSTEQASASILPDGTFATADLSPGTYQVFVNPSHATPRWVGGDSMTNAQVFTVTTSGTSMGDVVVTPDLVTQVRVVAPDGRPLAGAAVVATGPDGPIATVVADGDGRAAIQTPVGEWTIAGASLDGYVGERSLGGVRSDGMLTLQPTTSTVVEVSQPDGRPAAQMLVTVRRGEEILGQALTNNQGSYTFLGLPAGSATAEVHEPFGRYETPDVQLAAVIATGDPDDHVVSVRIGNKAPVFPTVAPPAGTVGEAYDYTFVASGTPAPTYELASGQVPPGLTLSAVGRLAGTPTVTGDYRMAVAATNSGGRTTTGELVVRVSAALTPPAPTSTSTPTVDPTPTPVVPAPSALTVLRSPSVKGKHVVGRVLKLLTGTTSPAATSVRVQWLRNGKAIKRATKAKYRLTAKDRGRRISLKVTFVRSGYASVTTMTKGIRVR